MSENAVKTRIWLAVAFYVILTLFGKLCLYQEVTLGTYKNKFATDDNQLKICAS